MLLTLLIPVILIELVLMGIALNDLIRRNKSDVLFSKKWPWVLLVILVQPIGPILYLTIGRINA